MSNNDSDFGDFIDQPRKLPESDKGIVGFAGYCKGKRPRDKKYLLLSTKGSLSERPVSVLIRQEKKRFDNKDISQIFTHLYGDEYSNNDVWKYLVSAHYGSLSILDVTVLVRKSNGVIVDVYLDDLFKYEMPSVSNKPGVNYIIPQLIPLSEFRKKVIHPKG